MLFKSKEPKVPQKPQLSQFDKIVISLAVGVALGGLFLGGMVISGAVIAALSWVVAIAVLFHKFPFVRKVFVKYNKFIDLLMFAVSFLISNTIFGFVTAGFAGIFVTAYLAINAYFYNLKAYKEYQANLRNSQG